MWDVLFRPEAGLIGLLASSFVSATLLPGASEAVLVGVVLLNPPQAMAAVALATLGNTLGGMTTWALGRAVPQKALPRLPPHRLDFVRRWGAAALLLSWLPLVGDALCGAAGWLRLHWLPCMLWMALGKGARYAAVAAAILASA